MIIRDLASILDSKGLKRASICALNASKRASRIGTVTSCELLMAMSIASATAIAIWGSNFPLVTRTSTVAAWMSTTIQQPPASIIRPFGDAFRLKTCALELELRRQGDDAGRAPRRGGK